MLREYDAGFKQLPFGRFVLFIPIIFFLDDVLICTEEIKVGYSWDLKGYTLTHQLYTTVAGNLFPTAHTLSISSFKISSNSIIK